MEANTPFSITTNGKVLDGFDPSAVAVEFAELFGCTPEKAVEFVVESKLIKKNLTQEQAELYRKNLAEIGLAVTVDGSVGIENMFTLVGDEEEADTQTQAAAEEGMMGAAAYAAQTARITPTMAKNETCCPKCKLVQIKTKECRACGIIYDRYDPANDPGVTFVEKRKSTDRRKYTKVKKEANAASYFLPTLAALLGVGLWAMLASKVGGELGVVAWGIGSAIGLAATFAGCGNRKVAGYCGIMALVAIIVGKTIATIIIANNASPVYSNQDLGSTAALADFETESKSAAYEYSIILKEKEPIKRFMIRHGYTDAEFADEVSDSEYNEFKESVEPNLEKMADLARVRFLEAQERARNAGTPEYIDPLQGKSLIEFMTSTTTWVDLLFLLIGVMTAYMTARASEDT